MRPRGGWRTRAAGAGAARIRRDEAEAVLSRLREEHQALHGQDGATRVRLDALTSQSDRAQLSLAEADEALAAARSGRDALPALDVLDVARQAARLHEAEAVAGEASAREVRRLAALHLEAGRRTVAEDLARRAEIEGRLDALRPQHLRVTERGAGGTGGTGRGGGSACRSGGSGGGRRGSRGAAGGGQDGRGKRAGHARRAARCNRGSRSAAAGTHPA